MEFHDPNYLFLLICLPIFFLWYIKRGQAKEATLRFSNIDLIPQKVIKDGRIKNILFIFLFLMNHF